MENEELADLIKSLYGKFDRVEQALERLVEVEVNQNYLVKDITELRKTIIEMGKELEKWRFARWILIGLGIVTTPIFVAGITKILGWH